ncbi:MAG: diacylglycerol kinase [Hyphomicrobiales bacterium]|nr:diacylglycerol kinase [Hyphomicrobiales bacterium]
MSPRLRLVIVAAVARNRVIGGDNRLLWKLSADMRHFKSLTMGKPLVMGRKTFESIGRPLPGRETIVVTRDTSYAREGILVAGDLAAALAQAESAAARLGADEIVIAGGGEIYAQTMGQADRMELTEVDLTPKGDTLFPEIDAACWREARRETHPADLAKGNEAGFAFVTYDRITKAGQAR